MSTTGNKKDKGANWLTKLGLDFLIPKDTTRPAAQGFATHAVKGEVEPVFESGGVTYYRFANEQRIPALRAMAALDVYEELEYKVTKEHLTLHFQAVQEAVDKGELGRIAVLTEIMQQRLGWITHIDLVYKLASVLYFDISENPESYDQVYNAQKIASWKADNEVGAFFLTTPIIELTPFSDILETDLQRFTDLQRSLDLSHLKALSLSLSKQASTNELGTWLGLQISTLQRYKGYSG
jgi:hypothetical protein